MSESALLHLCVYGWVRVHVRESMQRKMGSCCNIAGICNSNKRTHAKKKTPAYHLHTVDASRTKIPVQKHVGTNKSMQNDCTQENGHRIHTNHQTRQMHKKSHSADIKISRAPAPDCKLEKNLPSPIHPTHTHAPHTQAAYQ